MTGRSLHADFLAAAALDTIYPRILVDSGFSGGTLYTWTGLGDLSYGGHTYTGVGDLMGISDIQESTDLRISEVTLYLSAAKSAYKLLALTEVESKNVVTIRLALFTSAGALVSNPESIFVGYMDSLAVLEGRDTTTLQLTCVSRLAGMRQVKERRYTHEDQKQLYSTDTAFKHTVNAVKDTKWGSAPPVGGGGKKWFEK